jgi:hypothetical protein
MESRGTWKNKKYQYMIILLVGLFLGMTIHLAYGNQPHMDNALNHLQAARVELERATPNKGGHRERAIRLIDQAINQVRAGIKFANH